MNSTGCVNRCRYGVIVKDMAAEIIGSFLAAVAIYNFATLARFPMTGFSGIALLLYHLFGFPIGAMTIVLNIPVVLLCFRLLGKTFFLKSVRCMIIASLMIDYAAPLFPVYNGDRLLAAICTGVFSGIGYALIYMRNSSTGGADFIIMSIKAKNPHISLGKISFCLDLVIILAGGVIYNDADGIIYGVIINYIAAAVVDKLMYGLDAGKLALIITNHPEEVVEAIDETIQRGATILNAKGGYRYEEKYVVMCACSYKEMYAVEKKIKEIAPEAFIIITESNEVLGEGFKTKL